MRIYESLRDPDFSHSRLRGFHLYTTASVEGEGWSRVLFQHLQIHDRRDQMHTEIRCFFKRNWSRGSRSALVISLMSSGRMRSVLTGGTRIT